MKTPEQEKGAHGSCATVAVRMKDGSSEDVVNINEEDFDEEKHERVEAAPAEVAKPKRSKKSDS